MHQLARRPSATRATRASYALLFVFGLSVGLPGPAVPSLQAEYGLSYAGAALHLTLFSAGSAIGSMVDDRLGRRTSRVALVRVVLLGTIAGAALCGMAPTATVSLLGITLMGFCATIAMNVAHGVIGAEHGDDRGTFLVTAHLFAAGGLVSAAAVISGARAVGEWRLAFVAPVAVIAVQLISRIPLRLPTRRPGPRSPTSRTAPAPPAVRIGGLVLALAVTVEWAVMFWAASFLRDPVGLAPGYADIATVGVLATMVIGRWGLSRLTRRYGAVTLLRLAFMVTVAVSLPYLSGPQLPGISGLVVPIAALVMLCLLVTTLFPLGLTTTLATAGPSAADQQQASAVALGISAALTIGGPYLLGAAADATSLTTALLVLPTGAMLALAGIGWMQRQATQPAHAPPS